MKKLYISLAFLISLFDQKVFAQGCVAIRSNGGMCTMEHPDEKGSSKGWQINSAYRYFRSYKHFKGNIEQYERQKIGNEVINWSSSLDLSVLRQFNNRWSLGIGVPLVYNDRSSLYEHGRLERHSTSSYGLGDMRLTAYRWMLDPNTSRNGNFQIGLGVKLPTGNYNFKDNFYNVGPNKTQEERPVDQSIQPGDGGFGIITELNSYVSIDNQLSFYTNLYYLINPRETNGTRTYRETLSATLANESIMSVVDQYMARFGVNCRFVNFPKNFSVAGGFRLEGIPVNDLVGKSGGFRRPGYVASFEPAINYFVKRLNFFATVPIALIRNRTQSVTDKENSVIQGKFVNGDAAFADYSINAGFAVKF